MSVKRLWMVALLAVLTTSWNALAQQNQIAGTIGRTFISDQGIKGATFENPTVHFGNGLTFEINYARHILGQGFTKIYVEVPAVFNLDEDLNAGGNSVPESYKSIFVTPAIKANFFATTAIQPWVTFGGGWGYFKPSDHLEFGGSNPGGSTNTGVLQMGLGLDVRLKPRWTLRGGFRDFWSGAPDLNVDTGHSRQHNYFVSGGIAWSFGK